MKLVAASLVGMSLASRRHVRSTEGWTYVDTPGLEGNYYQVGGVGTADEAHAFCAGVGGFAPLSRTPAVMSVYNSFPNVGGTYWSGFKRISSRWQVFQSANPANTGDSKLPWTNSSPACNGFMHQGSTACARAYNMSHYSTNGLEWCINQDDCNQTQATILCLKNADPPSEAAEINSVADAWNELVTFTAASNHGCQCLNLLSDTRYPGAPVDDLDRTCLDWANAIKCQRFDGGVCGVMSDSDLPSYTNYDNCDDNADACAAALCKINKEFAGRINAMSSQAVQVLPNPVATCVRTNEAPNYDSCCFTDLFSSLRYDSSQKSCVNGAIVCPAGTRSVGATCEECPAGTFAAAGSDSCTTCPEGLFASAGSAECVTCDAPTDMIIQLDGSGSLNQAFWNNEINFVKDFLANFEISDANTRVSITQYNDRVTTEVNGFNLRDQSSVNSVFSGIRFQNRGCSTCSRIGTGYKTAEQIFDNHSRDGSKKVLVAFTDGFTLGAGENHLRSSLRALDNDGVKVFLILVHSNGESALGGYSMSDFTTENRFGFITDNWNNLGAVATAVQNSVCA